MSALAPLRHTPFRFLVAGRAINSLGGTFGTIALAFAVNAGFQVIAYGLTPGDVRTRLNVALIVANRNVGLMWAALGLAATPTMALVFTCAQLPIYTLPRVVQHLRPRLEAQRLRRRAR